MSKIAFDKGFVGEVNERTALVIITKNDKPHVAFQASSRGGAIEWLYEFAKKHGLHAGYSIA